MTIEELQEQVSDLKSQNEAMQAKNKEILGELKKSKAKSGEFDMDKFLDVQEQLDNALSENSKLQNDVKLKGKEFEKLTANLGEKESALHGLLIDQGLTQALTDVGVPSNLLKYVKADLKSQAKLHGENGQYTAMIGDKPLKEFIDGWKDTDGKSVIVAPNNTGGGANGGQGGGSNKSTTRSNFDSMNAVEKTSFIKNGGTITQ